MYPPNVVVKKEIAELLKAISGFTRAPRQFVETALRGVLNCQQPTQAPPQSQQHLAAHVFHVK